ncbi:hypothetical protein CHU98_g4356 [Xylaria longipes]|nr:hypothetical protein CHU98_g4356 [Xylaria longipes]
MPKETRKSTLRSAIKAGVPTRYNLRKRPLQQPIHYRFLNEDNFPFLTEELKNHKLTQLFVEDFPDSDYRPPSPPITTAESPASREVSPIHTPEDIDRVSLFGLEVITRKPTPEPERQPTPEVVEPPCDKSCSSPPTSTT